MSESLRYELDKRYVLIVQEHENSEKQLCTKYKTPNIRTTLVLSGHAMTLLFSRMSLPTSWFHQFFTPSLPPYAVAKAIIAAIDEQESRTIFLPFYTHFVRWVTILPSYLRDLFQWVSGSSLFLSILVCLQNMLIRCITIDVWRGLCYGRIHQSLGAQSG